MPFHCPFFRPLLGLLSAGRAPRKGFQREDCVLENIPRVRVILEKAELDCEVISVKLPTNSAHIADASRDNLS